jgi:multidrug efflux pump subunit AcrA (membrane-fusion protein)
MATYRRIVGGWLVGIVLLLAACGGATSQTTPVAVQPTAAATATATMQPTEMATTTPTTLPTFHPGCRVDELCATCSRAHGIVGCD